MDFKMTLFTLFIAVLDSFSGHKPAIIHSDRNHASYNRAHWFPYKRRTIRACYSLQHPKPVMVLCEGFVYGIYWY